MKITSICVSVCLSVTFLLNRTGFKEKYMIPIPTGLGTDILPGLHIDIIFGYIHSDTDMGTPIRTVIVL